MSGVWGWFGGQSAQSRKDSPKNAILGLRSQLEMLQKRERHLQNQMDEQDAIARKNVSTNKNGMWRQGVMVLTMARHICFCTHELLVRKGCGNKSLTLLNSRKSRPEAEEAARAHPRADICANSDIRATNILHRSSKYQQRDPGGHGACRRRHETNPWQTQY